MSSSTFVHSLTASNRSHAAETFRQRVVWLSFARLFFGWAAGWMLLWGCAVLIMRVVFPEISATQLGWGALGVIPALVGAGVMASRRAPYAGAVMALLDARSGAHGMMLLEEERGDLGAWSLQMPRPPELRLTWRPGKGVWAALLAAMFVAAAFAVPVPETVVPPAKLNVEAPVKLLQAQVAVLKEQGLLDESAAAAFKERLDKLQGSAQGENPAKTWEALDHLASQVQAHADKASEEAFKDAQSGGAALNLGAALDAHADELSPEQMADARQTQQELEDKAFRDATDGGLPQVKPPPGLQVPPNMLPQLSPDQRKAMREFLRKNQEQLDGLNRRLAQEQLTNGGQAPRPLTAEEVQKLIQAIKDGQSKGGDKGGGEDDPLGDLLAAMGDGQGEGSQPGLPGGAGGGKGPSQGLTWKDPSAKEGASFDPKAIDASPLDFKKSIKLNESSAAPEADTKASGSSGGGLTGQSDGGGSTARQNVLPKHRQAVDKYFERK